MMLAIPAFMQVSASNDGTGPTNQKYLPIDNEWEPIGARYVVSVGSNKVAHTIYFYDYDGNGNKIKKSTSSQTEGVWSDIYTDNVWTYDSNNNCTSCTQKATSEDGEEWDIWKHEYSYDAKGNMTEDVYYSEHDWELVKERRSTYTYDANNHRTSEISSYYRSDGSWDDNSKEEYIYDAKGNKVKYIHYGMGNGNWEKSSYLVYTYNDKNQLTKEEEFIVKDGKDQPYKSTTYTYDSNGNMAEGLQQAYRRQDGSSTYVWVFDGMYKYKYDAKKQLTDVIYCDNEEGTEQNGTRYYYDEQGRLTKTAYWSGGNSLNESSWDEIYYDSDALHKGKFVQGTCGTDGNEDAVKWNVDNNGTLTVTGTGAIRNYDEHYMTMPWLVAQLYINKIVIGEGITSVGDFTFEGAWNVTDISFPSTLESIGENAFMHNANVKTLVLPDALQTIGQSAFEDCASIDSIHFGNSLKEIQRRAFYSCHSIKSLYFPSTLTRIGEYAIAYIDSLRYFNIPEGTTIADRAFSGTEKVKRIDCLGTKIKHEGGSSSPFYCPNAALYVPVGYKSDFTWWKKWVGDVLEYGETYSPKQYIVNGKIYDYTEERIDVYGDESVIICGNQIRINNATITGGLSLMVDNAEFSLRGTVKIEGGLTVKKNASIWCKNWDKDILIVNGGIHSNETTEDAKIDIRVCTVINEEDNTPKARARSGADTSDAALTGFTTLSYDSDYKMFEPNKGYMDATQRALIDPETGKPATRLVLMTQEMETGISDTEVESATPSKVLEGKQIIINKNGKKYNVKGEAMNN